MRRGFLEELLTEPDGVARRADLLEKLDYRGSMRNRLCRLRALIKMYEDIGIVQREGVNSVRLIDRTAAENLLRQIKAGKEVTMRNRAANDRYREASDRLAEYDRRSDRTVEESNRLEQEKYEASQHASWWLRWNSP